MTFSGLVLRYYRIQEAEMYKTLLASVTVALLAHGAHAAYTEVDLRNIEQLVRTQQWAALHAYIEANPEVLVGDDPLAVHARAFMNSFSTNLFGQVNYPLTVPAQEMINNLLEAY